MAFSVVSSCPDCGAPIWADLEDQSQHNPPSNRFSCECRFEKDLPSQEVPSQESSYTIRYTPSLGPNIPNVWHNDQTQTPPNYLNLPWTGDPPSSFIPTVFSQF